MYPLDIFTLFPPFPRDNRVFVAMSFDEKYDNRWENVIEPAIKEVGLEPYRVDKKTISDSIITEIVSGIGNCRLFFADISAFDKLNDRPLRNENVLYEVGIAHSRRLPQEVILFRSDNYHLMFDLANVRVNYYDPETEPKNAKDLVIEALKSALEEIDLQKHFSVQKVVDSLTYDSIMFIFYLVSRDGKLELFRQIFPNFYRHSDIRPNSIHHLIDLNVICAEYPQLEDGVLKTGDKKYKFKLTSFGEVVAEVVAAKLGFDYRL